MLIVSVSSRLCRGCLGTALGDAGRSEPVPCGEGAGLGSGYSETVQSPAPFGATVFPHLPGGAGPGVLGSNPPEPGDLPKVEESRGAARLGRSQTAPPARPRSAPRSPGRCLRAP